MKAEGQWVDEKECLGFKYNISGTFTRLNSFMCLMEEHGSCQMQVRALPTYQIVAYGEGGGESTVKGE